MRKKVGVLIVGAALAAGGLLCAAQVPVPVSPGRADMGAVVEARCPTFSWAGGEEAKSYELVVYRVGTGGEEAEAVLRQDLPAPAYSWTPSLGSCLERGGQYAWSVRAVGRKEVSDWSAPSLFEVTSGPSEAEFELALEVVREYLARLVGAESEGVAAPEAAAKLKQSVSPLIPEEFVCSDAKPLDVLTMVWDGSQEVRIKAWKGSVGSTLLADLDGIAPGGIPGTDSEVTVSGFAGGPNDVVWEVFVGGTSTKLGESKFHLSCSDSEMNGPEDCGSNQGNGKANESGLINDWVLEGLSGNGLTLDCTETPEPPVVNQLSVDGGVVMSGYLQLATVSSAPPASDCDEASEEGRAKFDPTSDILYLCSGPSGWVSK